MLIFKQTSRITALDALSHDYFSDSCLPPSASSSSLPSNFSMAAAGADKKTPNIACDEVEVYADSPHLTTLNL